MEKPLWKIVCWFLKELNMELPYYPTIVLWKKAEDKGPNTLVYQCSLQHDL